MGSEIFLVAQMKPSKETTLLLLANLKSFRLEEDVFAGEHTKEMSQSCVRREELDVSITSFLVVDVFSNCYLWLCFFFSLLEMTFGNLKALCHWLIVFLIWLLLVFQLPGGVSTKTLGLWLDTCGMWWRACIP